MTDFHDRLAQNAAEIERALDTLLASSALAGPGAPPDRLIAAMRHGSLAGGKRLRPFLLRETAHMLGTAREHSLAAAVSVELVHCYSLIHDDLPAMDDDDLRRGRPTVHRAFDEATAILAGDALLTLAFAQLAEHGAPGHDGVAVRLVTELAAGAGSGGMVGGQMRDIEAETSMLDETEIARMQAMKTGALIRASVRIGAILAGAGSDVVGLTAYAEAAGRAFQLADDLLDATASPETMGKATGKDAEAGKQTLVARVGIDAAQKHLGAIVDEAVIALAAFGPEADLLRETARYFASRER